MPPSQESDDPVTAIADAWRRERPDLPVDSIGVITRVWQAAKMLGDERARLLRQHNADVATLDLLATLRRSGKPYRLTTRQLGQAALVSAGAISQRVGRAEKEGLVRRVTTAGSRTVDVELTALGHELVEHLVTQVLNHEEDPLRPMDATSRAQLADLLQQLLSHLTHRLGPEPVGHVGDGSAGEDLDGT